MRNSVKLDVFGRHLVVEWIDENWRTYQLGGDGKRAPVNVSIPSSLTEDDLAQFFDDIYHEAATPERPAVVRLC